MIKKKLDYTTCENHLDKWIDIASKFESEFELNESETRSKIIDPLFKDTLGWDESQISREEYVKEIGYYDYFFDSGTKRFILEAKKTTIEFDMPKSRTIKYKSLRKSTGLKAAIEQGINYAVPKSVDVVVTYNGKQLAVTYIPYIRLMQQDTYLFGDIKDIIENFANLYSTLSPIVENAGQQLESLLLTSNSKTQLIRNKPSFNSRITSARSDSDAKEKSNVLSRYFEMIHSNYFTDITSNEDLLMKCYVDSNTAKFGREIETVLRDRSPLLNLPVEIQEVETEKKSAGIFQRNFLEAKNNTKMFLLIGGSGVGKTTFIHRFFKFLIPKSQREFLTWLYIDFKKFSDDESINDFVYEEIKFQLLENYNHLELFSDKEILKSIFSKDLKVNEAYFNMLPTQEERNRKVADVIYEKMKDNGHFIKRIFEYLRSKELATCVVYDNVDQLDTDLQTRIFRHGNTLRENLKTTLICSLREEVYYGHSRDKSLNYAQIEVFHIPAPKFINVLAKRIKVLKDNTEEYEEFRIDNERGINIRIKKLDIIDVITKTFVEKQENMLLIEMLANRDIREALSIFKKILSSYNVSFDNLLTTAGIYAKTDKNNIIPIESHELLRGLALQDRKHYISTKTEPLINIFGIEDDGFYSHFTKLRILLYAESCLEIPVGQMPPGYVKIDDMYSTIFTNTVNNIDIFIEICKKLQIAGALINANGTIRDIDKDSFVILGAAGKYYLNSLIGNPFYLSLVAVDTQIANKDNYDRIKDMYELSLNDQTEPVKIRRYIGISNRLIQYLKEEEEKEKEYLTSIGVVIKEQYFIISKNIEDQFIKYCRKNQHQLPDNELN